MAQTWCLVKDGGHALIGVPMDREEKIVFNLHRLYGRVVLPHLFANWEQADCTRQSDLGQNPQPVHVLRK